ncbi:alpha-taxilin-like isoform X1 [Daktulosphaira vitifoliae]|uniref:alpha-taxilin-like isoform X1 n=1 Tax=Daktulosphaira vitifoliae TaxID=58002 RepID=UPI0021AAD042|nr:alpha-taxilin-like isoform X1 [Daktulosphaira vitifoliae]XP_050532364.1 alpha-taxilin-like isoform X1 [Daktulosphaira vitifoliae]
MEAATTSIEEPILNITHKVAVKDNSCVANGSTLSSSSKPNDIINSIPAATHASDIDIDSNLQSNEKNRKKKDRHLAQALKTVLNSMNSLNTPEEKLGALCIKYADLMDENTKLKTAYKQSEKKVTQAMTERDNVKGEMNKAIMTRSRLESLCRELQKQNKAIREESLKRVKEAEDKRIEMTNKFQNTLGEIATVMQQNSEKSNKLRDDNIDMSSRLKNVCEQYELREQVNGAQVVKLAKQIELETQLCDAKLAKANMEISVERETLLNEKTHLLKEIRQYQTRIEEMQATEIDLRNQISLYNEKYEEFQNALARSNKVFAGFKGDMELMSKKIVKQEKESASWKMRYERCQQLLDEMTNERARMISDLSVATRQLSTLQKLCRTLHSERQTLLSKLEQGKKSSDVPTDVISEELAERLTDISMCTMADWFARTEDPKSKSDALKEELQTVMENELKLVKESIEQQLQQGNGEEISPESPTSSRSHLSDEPAYDTGVSSSSSVNGDKIECLVENNMKSEIVDGASKQADTKKPKETQSKRKSKKT